MPLDRTAVFIIFQVFSEPSSVMVLVNDNNNIYSIIFVPMKDKVKEIWDGYRAGPEGAVKDYLFDQAFNNSDLDKEVPEILKGQAEALLLFWKRSGF